MNGEQTHKIGGNGILLNVCFTFLRFRQNGDASQRKQINTDIVPCSIPYTLQHSLTAVRNNSIAWKSRSVSDRRRRPRGRGVVDEFGGGEHDADVVLTARGGVHSQSASTCTRMRMQ